MSRKTNIIVGVALLMLILAGYLFFSPLAILARRIADADGAVVTFALNEPPPVSITITGNELKQVVGMVSAAHRDRKHYDCSPGAHVKFVKNTEVLAQMTVCNQLLWFDHKQYRDDSKLLDSLVITPLLEAKWEWESRQQTGTK